jgi:CRP/FNR family transcriptional regulator, cyclic AMP receptor protein
LHNDALCETKKPSAAMLLTIEKVLILKTVGVFSDISERGLVDAATALEEVRVEEGEKIFEKGDTGNSLYIVVEGSVRVHDGETTIATLGPGEVFGELAALDPEPRMASVTVVEPALLLRMGHAELDELIAEHPEAAIGIIRVLCRRLRKQAH